MKLNPEKSDGAIAAEIGVSHQTVKRARESRVTNVTAQTRIGRDGKKYRTKRKADVPDAKKDAAPHIKPA